MELRQECDGADASPLANNLVHPRGKLAGVLVTESERCSSIWFTHEASGSIQSSAVQEREQGKLAMHSSLAIRASMAR